jgi:hypothetical protein
MTKGEQKTYNILKQFHPEIKTEVSFPNLVGKNGVSLRFDFSIILNGELVLIEFDGEQHFQYTKHFDKTQSDFLWRLGNDRKKNRFCLSHNIKLIRIPFYSFSQLTYGDILFNPDYVVKSEFHNDYIRRLKNWTSLR